MNFKVGQGVVFYSAHSKLYVESVLDCFQAMPFNRFAKLTPGDITWIHFPEDDPFQNINGFLHVKVKELVLGTDIENYLWWSIGGRISGKLSPYVSDFTSSPVFRLSAPKKLEGIISKHPKILWPKRFEPS